MNRVIKFRAWNGEQMISPDYIDRNGSAWWKENSIPQMSKDVMLFTGLHDKNGVEIYDGDIFKYEQWHGGIEHLMSGITDWSKLGVILWHNKAACWIYRDADDIEDMTFMGKTFAPSFMQEVEVVGNVFQNPEMLQP